MTTLNRYFLGIAGCIALGAPGLGHAACDREPDKRPIQVKVDASGRPEVCPDPIDTSVGETLRWIFAGSEAKKFSIEFLTDEGSPFEWDEIKGATVTGTVVEQARGKEFKYDVVVEGKRLDPIIIVDN